MFIDTIFNFFQQLIIEGHILQIALYYLVAWIIIRFSNRIAGRLLQPIRLKILQNNRIQPERQATLRSILSSTIGVLAFIGATVFSIGHFISIETLVWMIGLFSAAFGLGARPVISNILTGLSFMLDDTFYVGDKVEIQGNEGVIEQVNLYNTRLRAMTGELFTIPNGEILVVRNFSRFFFL